MRMAAAGMAAFEIPVLAAREPLHGSFPHRSGSRQPRLRARGSERGVHPMRLADLR